MKVELHKMLEAVEEKNDRATFLAFVHALAEDWEDSAEKERTSPSHFAGPGANGWENGTLGRFLESAAAWAEATSETGDERALHFTEEPSCAAFARFLYAGKIYE